MFKSCASRDCYISRKAFASIFKSIEISKTKKKRNKIFVIFFSGAASLRDGERYIFEAILDSVGSPCASVAIQGTFIKSACIIYTNPFSQAEKRASPRETPPGHDGQQPQLCRREGETDGCLSTPLQKNRWKRRTGMTEPVDALDFNTEQRPTKLRSLFLFNYPDYDAATTKKPIRTRSNPFNLLRQTSLSISDSR